MILTAVLYLLYYLVFSLISLLPTGSGLNSNVTDAITSVFSGAHAVDGIFPVYTLVTVLRLVFGVEITIQLFRIFKWLVRVVRGHGGN